MIPQAITLKTKYNEHIKMKASQAKEIECALTSRIQASYTRTTNGFSIVLFLNLDIALSVTAKKGTINIVPGYCSE